MKRKRYVKLCSLVICFVLLFNVMSYSASAKYFSDTYVGMLDREFFDAMNYVTDNGWMNGTDATHFSPYVGITRGMFVTILYRYSGDTGQYTSNFTDVPSSVYYYNPISWANYHNIVNGITETTFEPETIITKEQMAVILYRYAKNIEGKTYTATAFSSISAHPDYSSVSPYAMEAVRWAKTYRVFPLYDETSYISPLANMNRAYTALYITNYSKNVTGFITKDRFSFGHYASNFSINYILSVPAYNKLESCIDNYYSNDANTANETKCKIKGILGTPWHGSCFGLTYCMFFDKIGKIDFNRNFANNVSTMQAVNDPVDNYMTESAINYYHFLQHIPAFEAKRIAFNSNSEMVYGFEMAYLYFQEYGAAPFSYYYTDKYTAENVGHTVILTNITRNSSKTTYYVTLADPNSSTIRNVTVTVNSSNVCFGDKVLRGIKIHPVSAISFLDNFDLDGNHNNTNPTEVITNNTSSADSVVPESITEAPSENEMPMLETVSLLLPYSLFKITNADGETLQYDGSSLSGDMKILDFDELENGPDHPSTLILTVERSDSFEYYNLTGNNTIFSVISPDFFSRIAGENIASAEINLNEKTMSVEGTDVVYSLWHETGIPGYEHFYLEGQNTGSFSLCSADQQIVFDNLVGVHSFGFSDISSLSVLTTQWTFSDNCSMDLSNLSASNSVQFIHSNNSSEISLPTQDPIIS